MSEPTGTIVFVDDEPDVLGALRQSLRRERKRWRMRFCEGGSDALDAIQDQTPDVVVTDMRMPKMDGAELLERVRQVAPEAIRIVLSGQSDETQIMRALPVAHQWLAKPCDRADLVAALEQAIRCRQRMADPRLSRIAGSVSSLPSPPQVHLRLQQALSTPNSDYAKVAEVVEDDVGVSVKVMQLANSAFFGLPSKITCVQDAVAMLGFETVLDVVASASVYEAMQELPPLPGISHATIQQHARRTGALARRMLEGDEARFAGTAGLLHDAGLLLLASSVPDRMREALELSTAESIHLYRAERECLGADHAEIGAYLLSAWGFPNAVTEAVALHHDAAALDTEHFGPTAAVYVANALADGVDFDAAQLEPFGLADEFEGWLEFLASMQGAGTGD